MYHTIKDGKNAIKSIDKVYPILEEIFNGRASMIRKEILEEYSRFEFETKFYGRSGHYSKTCRVLPTFETLRHLGLLVVIEEEESHMYSVEDNYYNTVNIDSTTYKKLPKVFQDMCEETNFVRYHYELTPKEIAVEKIIETVRNNFDSFMKLAD
jgi:hypothetical protein